MTREQQQWQLMVREEERAIIAVEGYAHVAGRYFADEGDVNRQRRWEAEKRIRQRIAQAKWFESLDRPAFDMSDPAAETRKRAELFRSSPVCAFCGTAIKEIRHAEALHFNSNGAWKLYHAVPFAQCALNAVMRENERLEDLRGNAEAA